MQVENGHIRKNHLALMLCVCRSTCIYLFILDAGAWGKSSLLLHIKKTNQLRQAKGELSLVGHLSTPAPPTPPPPPVPANVRSSSRQIPLRACPFHKLLGPASSWRQATVVRQRFSRGAWGTCQVGHCDDDPEARVEQKGHTCDDVAALRAKSTARVRAN